MHSSQNKNPLEWDNEMRNSYDFPHILINECISKNYES